MLKNLLNLFKAPQPAPDPTADWPLLNPSTPAIDWSAGTVGGLRLGADLESARGVFGKPDQIKDGDKGCHSLVYQSAGFEIDSEDNRFVYAAIFTQPDPHLPAGITPASSLIDGFPFSQETTVEDFTRRFGEAETPHDVDDEEIIVTYQRHGLTLELEFTLERTLKRLSLSLLKK